MSERTPRDAQQDESLFEGQSKAGKVIRIVIPPLTPLQRKIRKVGSQVGTDLRMKLDAASSLTDFMHAYYGINLYNVGSMEWMWEDGREPSVDGALSHFLSPELRGEAQQDAQAAEDLRPVVEAMMSRPGEIKMALKRIRDRRGYYAYGALAQFPEDVRVSSPVLGYTPEDQLRTYPDTVYFHPTTACVSHAADDLFRLNRRGGFYIPYKTREEAIAGLQYDEAGINEYQLKKTPEEVVKQDAMNYLLVGIHSAFSNELRVAPVSRFWVRSSNR